LKSPSNLNTLQVLDLSLGAGGSVRWTRLAGGQGNLENVTWPDPVQSEKQQIPLSDHSNLFLVALPV